MVTGVAAQPIERLSAAAVLLIAARRDGARIALGPCRPGTLVDAEAIQRATRAALGDRACGWKLGRLGQVYSAPMPADAMREDDNGTAVLPAGTSIELELALRFRTALAPHVLADIGPDDWPDLADLVPLFEFVRTRLAPESGPGPLDKIADCVSNHLAVVGQPTGPWRWDALDGAIAARLAADDAVIAQHDGRHPSAPLLPLLDAWRERCRRDRHAVLAGDVVTLGSLTGVLPVPPGRVAFVGIVAGHGQIECIVESPAP